MVSDGSFHHIDLTVTDVTRSAQFYGLVLPILDFRRRTGAGGTPIWTGAGGEIGLQPARSAAPHDRYAAGLHHLAFRADSRQAVDDLHAHLVRHAIPILDAPASYPQYAPGYYAVFFADPDGLKLELVHAPQGS
jgi:catechol-2,3-dioxygenase